MTKTSILLHGIQSRDTALTTTDKHSEEVKRVGYTIINSLFSHEEVSQYRTSLDKIYDEQQSETPNSVSNRDNDIVRALLAYDSDFLAIARHQVIQDICSKLLGSKNVLIMQNGIINRPDSDQYQIHWHRDLNFQHWTCSEVLAVNALVCIDDFTIENGCTYALPSSHLHSNFPSDEFVKNFEQPITANAGDVILMNSMLFHRASFNNSKAPRRAINNVIGRPFISQQIDLPRLLQGKYSEDPELSEFLGYKWNPAPSVIEWRKDR